MRRTLLLLCCLVLACAAARAQQTTPAPEDVPAPVAGGLGLAGGGGNLVGVSNRVTARAGASPQLKASERIVYGNINDDDDREFFRDLSPITHVGNVRAPLLVAHDANFPRDPVTESDQFVRAIRERGGQVEYLRWPDEGHSIRKLSNRVIAYRRIARFLARTLGPGVAACEAS